jgi:aspartyl-tRNA(Asn)/glutamyl-tRNA(Gln) amidotransferase subunit A
VGYLTALPARDIAAGVQRGTLSARETCEAALQRIERLNPTLNAVIGFDPDSARSEAGAIDKRIAAGEVLPLAGVPFTVKDNIWVGGRRITQGSKLFADFIAPRDAWSVARMRALGAVVVGITNCSEFACKGVTNNPLHGITRNPWDTGLTPGGSSGGAASATAAGFAPLALGTDAGGSTRRPAAHCGLVGMKPSAGIIPHPWGFAEPNFGLSVMGQLARNVADAALMLECLAGYDARDLYATRHVAAAAREPAKTLRIAWSAQLGRNFAIDADVRAALEAVVRSLARSGNAIEDADPQWPAGTAEYPLLALQQAGLAALYGKELDQRRADIDPDLVGQIEAGLKLSAAEPARALLRREEIAFALGTFFESHDLLLCPTAPVTAWPVEQLGPPMIGGLPAGPRGHAAFTPLFNYCGVPACSVPVALVRGLPVGLQIVAPRFEDARVLQYAAHVERHVNRSFVPDFN